MKLISLYIILCFSFSLLNQPAPDYIKGNFTDDYNISYTVTDTTWIQWPDFEMNIIEIDTVAKYILGYDTADSTYTRVDYRPFTDQGDFKWGFCYTAYEQVDRDSAMQITSADRDTPRTGCNGFPFSRMKRK